MIRALLIGLAAVALTASAPPDTIAWQGIVLRSDGWRPVTSSDDLYIFTKDAVIAAPGANPQVWVRTEWPSLQRSAPPYRSIVELVEVNCATGLWRDRQETEYPQNNAGGQGTSSSLPGVTYGPDFPYWSDASWFSGDEAAFELMRTALAGLACPKTQAQ